MLQALNDCTILALQYEVLSRACKTTHAVQALCDKGLARYLQYSSEKAKASAAGEKMQPQLHVDAEHTTHSDVHKILCLPSQSMQNHVHSMH